MHYILRSGFSLLSSGFLVHLSFWEPELLIFIPSDQGAAASTVSATASAASPSAPIPREQVRHLLLGSPAALQGTIRLLHKLGYAEVNDWSRSMSTGRVGEVTAILTKQVEVG